MNHHIDFHDDPCTHVHVRDKIMHSYSIRLYFNKDARCQPLRAHVCTDHHDRYTESLSLKFYEDPFIGCGEIAETKLSMHYSHFLNVFLDIFQI